MQERREDVALAALAHEAHQHVLRVGRLGRRRGRLRKITRVDEAPRHRIGQVGHLRRGPCRHGALDGLRRGRDLVGLARARRREPLGPDLVSVGDDLHVVAAGEQPGQRLRGRPLQHAVQVHVARRGRRHLHGAGRRPLQPRPDGLDRLGHARRELARVENEVRPHDDDARQRLLAVVLVAGPVVGHGQLQQRVGDLVVVAQLAVVALVGLERSAQRLHGVAVLALLDLVLAAPQQVVGRFDLGGSGGRGSGLLGDGRRQRALVEQLHAAAHR